MATSQWQFLVDDYVRPAAVNVVRGNSVTRVGAAFVTGSFFRTLEATPEVGRSLDANDDRPGHEHVAVISDALWRSDFGAGPDVVGKQMRLDRRDYTVVGVMPKDFGYPFDGDIPYDGSGFKRTDIWLPAAYTVNQKTNRTNFNSAVAIGDCGTALPRQPRKPNWRLLKPTCSPSTRKNGGAGLFL